MDKMDREGQENIAAEIEELEDINEVIGTVKDNKGESEVQLGMKVISGAGTICLDTGLCRVVFRSCKIMPIVDNFFRAVTWLTFVIHIVLFAVGSLRSCRGPLKEEKYDRSNINDSLGVASEMTVDVKNDQYRGVCEGCSWLSKCSNLARCGVQK